MSADQMGLFGESEPPRREIRSWRRTKLDSIEPDREFDPSDPDHLIDAAEALVDVVKRNREFQRLCEIRDTLPDDAWLERFLEAERKIIASYLSLRLDADQIENLEEDVFARARRASKTLADLRVEFLESLDDPTLDEFLKGEPRVKANEIELRRDLAAIEFELAEERGQIVEFEFPL